MSIDLADFIRVMTNKAVSQSGWSGAKVQWYRRHTRRAPLPSTRTRICPVRSSQVAEFAAPMDQLLPAFQALDPNGACRPVARVQRVERRMSRPTRRGASKLSPSRAGEGLITDDKLLAAIDSMCSALPDPAFDTFCTGELDASIVRAALSAYDLDDAGGLDYASFVTMVSGFPEPGGLEGGTCVVFED